MDVGAPLERLLEMHVARDVSKDAQLDLAVVRGEQDDVVATGYERVSDAAAELRADGDVLQVRIGGAQTAGGCHGLMEAGVEPTCCRIEQERKRLDVRR